MCGCRAASRVDQAGLSAETRISFSPDPQSDRVVRNGHFEARTTEALPLRIVENAVKGHRVTGNLHIGEFDEASRSLPSGIRASIGDISNFPVATRHCLPGGLNIYLFEYQG